MTKENILKWILVCRILLAFIAGYMSGQVSVFLMFDTMLDEAEFNFEINESEMVDRIYEIIEERSPYVPAIQHQVMQTVK